ncbi:DUF4160 domain-containing protein [Peribacillus butanolivorans]|uniref:DUF4160 domain-containing protein n=1 Tax=Peribacillus butanolivorans TaxID=421767 RepID=UPI0035DB4A3F
MELEIALAELLTKLSQREGTTRNRIRYKIKRRNIRNLHTSPPSHNRTIPSKWSLNVGLIRNIRLIIWPNDHGPAHFHAKCNGHFDIRVNIETCKFDSLKFGNPSKRVVKEIEEWALLNQSHLLDSWERMRPTDIEVRY